jgi:glycosyltransferase involved in cell wall biosynthesis
VFCPSAYLRDVALGWGLDARRSSVLPNPAPEPPHLPDRAALREELALEGNVLVFAGRLGPQKDVGTLLEALGPVPTVTLAIAGDGPERAALERRAAELGLDARVRFLGSVPRETVLRLFGAADASVLPSAWENFPHTVVEALAVGCPVIASAVGGVPEVVVDGENGLLVPARDAHALAAAIARFFSDDGLRDRLAGAAARSVAGYSEEAVFATIEAELEKASSE